MVIGFDIMRRKAPMEGQVSKTVQQKMHEQHRRWRSATAAWRFDVEEWRKELRAASAALDDIRDALRDALDALDVHAQGIWEEEQRSYAHELALCRESVEGQKKTDKQWAAIHRRQAAQHERLAGAHARLKKYNHRVVAEIRRLLEQARAAI